MSKRKYYPQNASESKDFSYYAKKLLTSSCIIYTVIILFLATVISVTNTGESDGAVFFSDLLLLFPLSFVVACANLILSNKKINFCARIILHAIIVFSSFALYLLAVKQYEINSFAFLAPVFAIVYAIIMAIIFLVSRKKGRKENNDEEYEKIYENITSAQKRK